MTTNFLGSTGRAIKIVFIVFVWSLLYRFVIVIFYDSKITEVCLLRDFLAILLNKMVGQLTWYNRLIRHSLTRTPPLKFVKICDSFYI